MSHKIFDSDWDVFTKNFINEVGQSYGSNGSWLPNTVWTLNINNLLFNCNRNNVFTCHMLCVLECRWSHSHCDRCIHKKNQCLESVLHEKNGTESLVRYILNQQYSVKGHKEWWKKIYRILRLVLDKQKSTIFVILE